MRVLSGIQPSGKLHLGNYFGAMKQHIALQEEHECFFFVANFHALTTIQNPAELQALTLDVALDYVALGLDPNKAALFRQSDVPEVTELTWILATVTGKGLMERAHSYKDKITKGVQPSMGLFNYPILMASDILIYRPNAVPVGKDQVQHIEMTQDMAGHFNNTYKCDVLVRPEPLLGEAPFVPGIDGQKMSKSYGNHIELFDDPKIVKKRIMSIKTDSTPVEAPKNPDNCNAFAILKLLADEAEAADWAKRYRAGGVGYGDVKKRIVELFEQEFGPARERRAELAARPQEMEDILVAGAQRARKEAQETMKLVREACGLVCVG
ncbi:MAG: tryptophan--tRNA ligase [Planctomycetes bacterium]|nr:tryptophan--tRNA ligase [Planctomycetota bacterium]MCH8968026.1 tryptophan--tRNA ligase [Planctomycetota bacterium]